MRTPSLHLHHVINCIIPNKENNRNPKITVVLVGVTGFEPAASTSQMSRATNCATPRYIKLYQIKLEKSSSTVVVKYRVKPQKTRFESAKNPVFMRVFKSRGLNRSLSPKAGALPTALHLEITTGVLYLKRWENATQKKLAFSLWV